MRYKQTVRSLLVSFAGCASRLFIILKTFMKKAFILHYDSLSILDKLTDVQCWKLFKKIRSYHIEDWYDPNDIIIDVAFEQFKNQFDRDIKLYEKKCEKNRINWSKWWRPPKTHTNPKNPSGYSENPSKPKKPDKDNDSVSDKENNSSKEEEQAPEYWKNYINEFIAKCESIYSKYWLVCDLSNRRYAGHRINEKWISKNRMKAINKLWYTDIFVFIEDIISKAIGIKYWNYVDKITNLYSLRNNYPKILNLTKKEISSWSIATTTPTTFVWRKAEMKTCLDKIDTFDENMKYKKVLSAVKFIRSFDVWEEKEKKRSLAKQISYVFWQELYSEVWEETRNK